MADFPSLTGLRAASRAAVRTLLGAAALAAGLAAGAGDASAELRHPISHVGFLTQFGTDHGKFDAARWWIAHNISNNSPQHNIGWQRDAVRHLTDRIELSILDRPYRDRDYSAGAVKTYGRHGFGRFDVIMQPQFAPGAISAFFVYTGPAFLTRHDEIDFEFTGRNPRQVDINTYVDGRNSRLEPIDLDFRYDEAPHAYAFEWTPDYVRWFIDGEQIAEVTGEIVPQVPGKITTSIWAGKGLIRWAGKFDPASLPLKSDVFCMSWRSHDEPGETCTDRFLADPEAWKRQAEAGTQ